LASDHDHRTRTLVVMDSKGKIIEVILLQGSGVTRLDDAAVEAFNKAGPFPNPPEGLIDEKGKVVIRWDFVLKT